MVEFLPPIRQCCLVLTLLKSTLIMGHRGKGGHCLPLKCCGMSEVQEVSSLCCLGHCYVVRPFCGLNEVSNSLK